MGLNLVVALIDNDWHKMLSQRPELDLVNCWGPKPTNFKALEPGGFFLFKLHAPVHYIVGGGIFKYSVVQRCSHAWNALTDRNGARSLPELCRLVARNRDGHPKGTEDFEICSRIVSKTLFFEESDWIPSGSYWTRGNRRGFQRLDTDTDHGRELWERVAALWGSIYGMGQPLTAPRLVDTRLEQQDFREMVINIYGRRCAVTREATVPALDAAHILPFSDGGPSVASNGLLLRKDIHGLFDGGYVTVTTDHRFEVSQKIQEEFGNGRDYRKLHGKRILVPKTEAYRPARQALAWHNEQCFKR